MKTLLLSLIFYLIFFRISIINSFLAPYLLFSAIALFYSIWFQIKTLSVPKFYLIGFILFLYSFMIDFILIQEIKTFNAFFTIRILSLFILIIFPGILFKRFLKNREQLIKIFKIVVIIQFSFFLILYFSPSLKFSFYSFFNLSDSVNLYPWNLKTRGFSIVPGMNFLGTIVTGILALVLFKNYILKFIFFFSQVINVNTTLLSLILLKINLKVILGSLIAIFSFIYIYYDLIALIAPRFYDEMESGFTRTIFILLENHLILLNSNLFQILFGVPINILPEANESYASDIGWIILLNYGGLVFIFLYLLFFIIFLKNTIISNKSKLLIFILFLLFNFKGLVLGPNVFWFFLWMFHPYGYSVTFKNSLKQKIIF